MILQCKSSSINQLDIKLGVKHIFEILYLKSFVSVCTLKFSLFEEFMVVKRKNLSTTKNTFVILTIQFFLALRFFRCTQKKQLNKTLGKGLKNVSRDYFAMDEITFFLVVHTYQNEKKTVSTKQQRIVFLLQI